MTKKMVRIVSQMPARPDWVKVNSTISFPLRNDHITKLAESFSEATKGGVKYANVEVSFTGSLSVTLEISYELP